VSKAVASEQHDGLSRRKTLRWAVLGLIPLVLLAAVLVVIIATGAGLGDRANPTDRGIEHPASHAS